MIIGIGTDIIEMERVKKALSQHFLERCYTKEEQQLILNLATVEGVLEEDWQWNRAMIAKAAGNFSAKEALVKALGTGFREGVELSEIAVLREHTGKPYITVTGNTKQLIESLGIQKIHVSLSNIEDYAQAFVVCEA